MGGLFVYLVGRGVIVRLFIWTCGYSGRIGGMSFMLRFIEVRRVEGIA